MHVKILHVAIVSDTCTLDDTYKYPFYAEMLPKTDSVVECIIHCIATLFTNNSKRKIQEL